MKRNILFAATASLAIAGAVAAAPIAVRTEGTKSQAVIMCPDCRAKAACAQVGDYRIGLTVDLENSKHGTGQIVAHVQDKAKKPVTGAKVTVTVTMPNHEHDPQVVTLKHAGHGRYVAAYNRLNMTGGYRAEVAVTPATGDVVKQVFTFAK